MPKQSQFKNRCLSSIVTDLFLAEFNIPLNKFIHFIYPYGRTKQKDIIEMVGISKVILINLLN